MAKLKRLHIKELIICLIVCVIPFAWSLAHVQHFEYTESIFVEDDLNVIASRTMHHGIETIDIKERKEEIAGGDFYTTHYDLSNGDTVVIGSLRGLTEEGVVLQTLHISGSASMHILDNGSFDVVDLAEGQYDASLFLIDSASFDIACYTPKQYEYMINDALDYKPENDGYLNVKATSDGFDIEIITKEVPENCCSDFMLVYSENDLMDWSSEKLDGTWLYYTMDGDNRWTYTGYYRISPDNYYPTGPNVYHRCQACYLGASFVKDANKSRCMEDMLCCIVDVMALQQNDTGFFPSTSRSEWLYGDYNIEAPYYDTRFNSDLLEIFCQDYNLYQTNTSYKAIEKYVEFYKYLIETVSRDDGNGGIWMPDYWEQNGDIDKVHTSLNHQLSELIVNLKASYILNDKELEEISLKMLKAVTNEGMAWVQPNGAYEYCIFPDGSFGLLDYDTLTYNDMFRLQALLEEHYGYRDEMIDQMMAPKLQWMINRGITDYYQ